MFTRVFIYGDDTFNIKMSTVTAENTKFSIKHFFSKCDQIRSFLWIWLHLLKKFSMENFVFCTASDTEFNYFIRNLDQNI